MCVSFEVLCGSLPHILWVDVVCAVHVDECGLPALEQRRPFPALLRLHLQAVLALAPSSQRTVVNLGGLDRVRPAKLGEALSEDASVRSKLVVVQALEGRDHVFFG
jgi:hypothetical protein